MRVTLRRDKAYVPVLVQRSNDRQAPRRLQGRTTPTPTKRPWLRTAIEIDYGGTHPHLDPDGTEILVVVSRSDRLVEFICRYCCGYERRLVYCFRKLSRCQDAP